MQHMNRIQPQGRVQDYKTYQILAPVSSHRRPATCAEINCPNYLGGWKLRIEGLPPEMVYAARTSGRKFTELDVTENEHWLIFEAGQACFRSAEHTLPLDKQEIFIARDGDFRGNPTGNVRKHTRPEFWLEDMQENLGRLHALHERG